MKIAIPINNNRVSPRFLYTDKLFITVLEQGVFTQKEIVMSVLARPFKRIQSLIDLNIEVLICSGIDRFYAMQIEYMGIMVYQGVYGDIEEVLQRFLNKELESYILNIYEERRCVSRGSGRCRLNKGHQINKKLEETIMPGNDGTGAQGDGPRSGDGLDPCGGGQRNQSSSRSDQNDRDRNGKGHGGRRRDQKYNLPK